MPDYSKELARFPKKLVRFQEMNKPLPKTGTFIAVPHGRRTYAWFTTCDDKNVCFLVDGRRVTPVVAAFSSSLIGTVLDGTVTNHEGKRVFVAEAVCLQNSSTPLQCFEALPSVLERVDNRIHIPSQLMFLLPATATAPFFDAPYRIRVVKHLSTQILYQSEITETFRVVALPQSDSYEIWRGGENVGLAYVHSLDHSIRLNALFRHRPENADLDCAEESDDEVDLLGEAVLECRMHPIRKKWVPLCV
jgi:hypothetical protein